MILFKQSYKVEKLLKESIDIVNSVEDDGSHEWCVSSMERSRRNLLTLLDKALEELDLWEAMRDLR